MSNEVFWFLIGVLCTSGLWWIEYTIRRLHTKTGAPSASHNTGSLCLSCSKTYSCPAQGIVQTVILACKGYVGSGKNE